jgi:hypothetical protein
MKSNRRADPLQATLRVAPGRRVLENDGAVESADRIRANQGAEADDNSFDIARYD